MASVSRLTAHFIRNRPTVAAAYKYFKRRLIDLPLDDILLREGDFPPLESDYLTLVKKKYFLDKYGIGRVNTIFSSSPNLTLMRKVTVILPLETKLDGYVVPIPFIVNTGAPGLIYLGSKPLEKLNELDLIKGELPESNFHYRLDGKLTYGKNEIEPVLATKVPPIFEQVDSGVQGDIRCNILGLHASVLLGLIKIAENTK